MRRCRLQISLFICLLLSCFINSHLLAGSLNDTINSLTKGGFKERAKVIGSNFYQEILAGLNITTYFFKNKLLLSINDYKNNYLPSARNRFIEMIEKL